MACSGAEGIKTAAAAAADDSVQFWKAHKHMHIHMTQERTACLCASNLVQAQAVSINIHMHAYTVLKCQDKHAHTTRACTFIQAIMHNIQLRSVSLHSLPCLSLTTVSFWTAAVTCHVSLCHVIWAVRFLTHRLTPVSSNARHSHQTLQMAERQIDGATDTESKKAKKKGEREEMNQGEWEKWSTELMKKYLGNKKYKKVDVTGVFRAQT